MILEGKDITPEFAENLLDKVHLAMSKIDPHWQELAMTDPDSTETIVHITRTKIQGYKWVLNSSGKGFNDEAKTRLSEELEKLGEDAIPLFLSPKSSSKEIPHVENTKQKKVETAPPSTDKSTGEIHQLDKIQKSKLPSQAQLNAGNYKKKHCRIHGLDIAIENPKNSYRSGIDPHGKKWKCKIYYDYGYIKRTTGADGDHLDVFIGPNENSEIIFVINQVDPKTQEFDEHKVMIGFTSEEEAKKGYLKNYEKDWKGFGSITALTLDQFKTWIEKGFQKKELIDPEIEFLKSDLSRLIEKNNQEISVLKSQLALQPVTVHGKHGTYIQMRKVKVGEDYKESSSQGFQLQSETYKKPRQKRLQERPKYKIKPEDSQPLNLITNIKNILLNNGQIEKAKEFTELAYIAETVDDIYAIANDYVELEGNRARHRFTEDDELELFKGIDYRRLQPKKILDKLGRWTTVFVRTLLPFVDERRKKQLQEFKSVIQKYRNTPLWMKAPNGEPTNLSKKEWIKSRTTSFKTTYGDWEGLALKRYLKDSEPVKNCKGEVPSGLGIKGTVEWFEKEIGKQFAIRKDLGRKDIEVEINGRGIKNSLSKRAYPKKFQSILAIKSVIEKGRLVDVSLDQDRVNTLNYHFVAPITIDSIRLPMIARVISDNNSRRFYLHEVVIIKDTKDSSQTQPLGANHTEMGESNVSNPTISSLEKIVNKNHSADKPSTYRNILNALRIDPNTIKIKLQPNGEPDMQTQSIIKSSVLLTKKRNRISSEAVMILKAKRRKEGETWTQPSGRKVTKKNGKIIPVSEGRKEKETPDKQQSLGDGKEIKKTLKENFDHSKLVPGFQFNSGGKRYEVVQGPQKNAKGKMEAIFKIVESGGKIGAIPSQALEESSKGGFSDTSSKIADAVTKAKSKKSKEIKSAEQTEFNEPKEQGEGSKRPEKGIDVPSSLPATQIRRATQYTDEKDYDKETINSLKERILKNGYDPAFPIMVDKQDGQWTVVAGHHRHTAVEQLINEGLLPQNFQIPVVTKEFASDNDRLAAQVSENQRRNVLPTDEAKAYGQMAQNGWDVKKIAEKLGKKPGDINKRLALNNLEPDLFNLVKRKDKSLPLGVAEVIGMNAKDSNGNPSHSMQIRAFKWYVENRAKYPGRGPSVVQSFIKELQSGDLSGMDFDSVATDAQKEALRTLGSAEKAQTNKKMIEGMLDSLTKSYQRILGDNISDLNPQTIKELAASLTLTGGSVGGSAVLGKLDAVIQDLSIIKDRITQKIREIEADAQTPMMFGMAKSTLAQTDKLLHLFLEERDIIVNIQKGKVA